MSKNRGRATQHRRQRIINLPSTFIETDSHYLKYRSVKETLHDVEHNIQQAEIIYCSHASDGVDVTVMYSVIDDLRIACARLERLLSAEEVQKAQ